MERTYYDKNKPILPYLQIILTPYLVLGLCLYLVNYIRFTLANVSFSYEHTFLAFILILASYLISGILLATLAHSFAQIRHQKTARIIVLCNLALLVFSYIISFFGVPFFFNIDDYFMWAFLLMGFYGTLAVQAFVVKNL